MSASSSITTFDERLNKQLINCLNIQTNAIQNLAQYSQHISLQLFEIRSNVEILANRVITLEQQQQSQLYPPVQMHILPSFNPLFFPQATIDHPSLFQISTPTIVPSPSKPFFSDMFKTTMPDATVQPPPFSFLMTPNEKPSNTAPFVFGPISSSGVNNSLSNPDDEDEDDSDESTASYKPVIHLQPIEEKTGEEDENILFCERARLYRFDSTTNQQKERGIGPMKILQHKTTNVCRILMRREQVLKVCANHKISSQMELKPHFGTLNAYVWSAIDSADGVPNYETLCVRFKTNEQAKRFVKIFNEAKEINDLLSIGNISLNDDDIITIGEVQPTREQIERAKILQLPLTFYLYENKKPCKGCPGCEYDLPLMMPNEIHVGNRMSSYDAVAFDNLPNFPSGFFPNASLPSLMSMVPAWFSDGVDSFSSYNITSPPKDSRMIIKAKRCLPSNRLPPPPSSLPSHADYEQTSSEVGRGDEPAVVQANQKKSRNLSSNITEPFSLTNYASQMAQTILDRVKQELYKQTITIKEEKANNKPSIFADINANSNTSVNSTISSSLFGNSSLNNGFSFTNFGNTTTPSTEFQFSIPINTSSAFTFESTANKPLFGDTPKLSFSDIAKKSSDSRPITNDTEERVFPGQGSLIFGKLDDDDVDEGGGDEGDSYVTSFSFKPVVQLQPVEVKTGEEDENILFCERAKLYRFDSTTNQQKERGIGPMKILQHKTTNVCRILMRREQVLKVCANHKISSQMELKPHCSTENAYVWSAVDYADREAKNETLCVKFKTSDIAKRFYQQFNDAKQINAEIQQ